MSYFRRLMDSVASPSYALFRMVLGFLFMWHGTQKLYNYPAEFPYDLSTIIMTAGIIELLGGLAVLIGVFTRPAAFICSGTMAVAYWMVHGTNGFFPLNNGGELAALYCFGFLCIASNGAGRWSVDKYFFEDQSAS